MSGRSSTPSTALNPLGPPRPVRTCVGCRVREHPAELLRVVAVDGVVIPDLRRRLPGRGAWLHPDLGCLGAAERRRAFGRALRVPKIDAERLDTTEVRVYLEGQESTGSSRSDRRRQPITEPPESESRSTQREHAVKQQ
jgi:predicted RNA-binding protein YlxR (DUF448 family)